jgi:hypothetical protein
VDLRASEAGPELRQWRALMRWIDEDRVPRRHSVLDDAPASAAEEPGAEPADGPAQPAEAVAHSLLSMPPWGIAGDADADRPARQNGDHADDRRR